MKLFENRKEKLKFIGMFEYKLSELKLKETQSATGRALQYTVYIILLYTILTQSHEYQRHVRVNSLLATNTYWNFI